MSRNQQLTTTVQLTLGEAFVEMVKATDKWLGRFTYIDRLTALKQAKYLDGRWGKQDNRVMHIWEDGHGILVGLRVNFMSASCMRTELIVAFDPEVTTWSDAVAVFLTLANVLYKSE